MEKKYRMLVRGDRIEPTDEVEITPIGSGVWEAVGNERWNGGEWRDYWMNPCRRLVPPNVELRGDQQRRMATDKANDSRTNWRE